MTFKRFWEMKTPNPFAKGGEEEIFKCTKCGSETFHDAGWNGEPSGHKCTKDCNHGDVPTAKSGKFTDNISKVNWDGYVITCKSIKKKDNKTVYVF